MRPNLEHVTGTSADWLAEQTGRLRELFPEAFTEGKVDFDKLRAALGEEVDSRPERYSFGWAGKREAIRLLQTPSRATLVPCPEQSVNFEQTGNIFIEGDNLEVLKLLYKSYFGRVKMIYIDPPYNTGNDFIYPDNFTDPLDTYLKLTGQKDSEGNLLASNPEKNGRYHSAWLSMMYPRLFLARQLLREDGVIFISIDDHEVHNLGFIANEVFGEENRIESFVWKKSYGGGAKEKYAVTQHDYILLYARNLENIADLWLPPDPEAERKYYTYRDEKFDLRGPYRLKPLEATKSMDRRENLEFPIPLTQGGEVKPKRQWWWGRDRVLRALAQNELVFTKQGDGVSVSYKQYLRDEQGRQRGAKPFSVIDGIYTQHGTADLADLFDGQPIMQFPKPVALMKKLVSMVPGDDQAAIILDFFAGSCTTAQAVLEVNSEDGENRNFIMVQLPEPTPEGSLARRAGFATVAEIGKERIRRVMKRMSEGKPGETGTKLLPECGGLGIRLFKLAESNYKVWPGPTQPDVAAYEQQMELRTDPLVPRWEAQSVIWEATVKEGYSLSSRIERVEGIESNAVYRVTDPEKGQSFRICLDDALDPAALKALALSKDDLFICRDKALDDTLAANLALQCRLKVL